MAINLVHFVWFFMARSSDQLYKQNCGLLATLKPSVAIIYQPEFLPKSHFEITTNECSKFAGLDALNCCQFWYFEFAIPNCSLLELATKLWKRLRHAKPTSRHWITTLETSNRWMKSFKLLPRSACCCLELMDMEDRS